MRSDLSQSAQEDRTHLCGQSLIECVVLILVLSGVLVSSSMLIYKKWIRFQCAYFVFEATHSYLIGAKIVRVPIPVRIEEFEWGIRGEGSCHGLTERVELPWLEQASWQ